MEHNFQITRKKQFKRMLFLGSEKDDMYQKPHFARHLHKFINFVVYSIKYNFIF